MTIESVHPPRERGAPTVVKTDCGEELTIVFSSAALQPGLRIETAPDMGVNKWAIFSPNSTLLGYAR